MNKLKHFSIIFFPFFLVLLVISSLMYKGEVKAEYVSLESKAKYIVDMISGFILEDLKEIEADISHLVKDYKGFLDDNAPADGKDRMIARDIIHFAEIKKMYSRIRIVGNTDKNVITVDYADNKAYRVPGEYVRDATSRKYLNDASLLKSGQIFVSPFDLNVDNGQVEYPLNPVIRFISPVFSSSEKREGAVVLNFSGRYLILKMRKIENKSYKAAGVPGKLMLLNDSGYWLMSDNPRDEWGFMFEDGTERTFENRYPDVWAAMSKKDSGTLYFREGIFVFDTVSIARMGFVGRDEWKIVFFIPSDNIRSLLFSSWIDFVALTSLFSLILFIVSLFLAHSNVKREDAEKELQKIAKTDSLTSLYNRRFFLDQFEYERVRSERYHADISVVMGDIDHLKVINDKYGHEAGDYVLRTVAYIMKSGLRKQDTICRWGGEEFIIILPETNVKNAVIGIERIRSIIESYEFIYEGNILNVTMSFGVFQNSLDLTMEECIKRADEFLYLSKNKGRNRVTYMDESGL